ncbi:MAG: arginine--tRNA ligase [Planctomycetota bacterium]|jgi:arginyl-tRNA synthetase
MNLRKELESRISQALTLAGAPEGTAGLVIPSTRAEFGDYQVNGVMATARQLKTNPLELAEKVIAAARLDDLAESVEIAGPGFINIHLKTDFLARSAAGALCDEHLGVEKTGSSQTVVVDYSGPNLAKEMHVGHLRSTIIGDALVRVLEFLGNKVIRQNHVGDWGTQFGMLIAHENDLLYEIAGGVESKVDEQLSSYSTLLSDMEEFYREAKRKFDTDPKFAEQARECVVNLQAKRPDIYRAWERVIRESLRHCFVVYERLQVGLEDKDIRGESAYNDDLPNVVADLKAGGLLTESEGAQCVFLDEFTNKDGEPLPVIVRKSDGGYLYATTDLAAIRYRVGELSADRILYVTDSRQNLHFQQIFAVVRKATFAPENTSLEHVAFGMMMGADNRPFKTREGGTVKLMDLLDEAENRAGKIVEEKNPDLSASEKKEVARVVGIGAVKYADLVHNRTSDYVFSWDKMLSLDGNTAPYMQYAYARIRSIFRKGEELTGCDRNRADIHIDHPTERALTVKLLQFPETLDTVATECYPHLMCNYLFELATAFMGFYENCPVLQSDAPLRASRLALCELTARTIKTALDLLGIETLERM